MADWKATIKDISDTANSMTTTWRVVAGSGIGMALAYILFVLATQVVPDVARTNSTSTITILAEQREQFSTQLSKMADSHAKVMENQAAANERQIEKLCVSIQSLVSANMAERDRICEELKETREIMAESMKESNQILREAVGIKSTTVHKSATAK